MKKCALEDARNMVSLIIEQRQETESGRRVAAPIVKKLIDTRLCRMAVLEDLGGLEMSPVDALPVIEILAGAEASVSWTVWNNTLVNYLSRFLLPDARAEIFADPTWLYANSTRPSGRASIGNGGYTINGRWSLVSGCELAEWMPLACFVEEGGELKAGAAGAPEMRFAFLKKNDVEILDTWYVGGLRGSGSHDVVVKDVFVPAHYTFLPSDGSTIDHPLGCVPILAAMVAGLAAQTLGVAQAALDTVIDMGHTKITPGPMPDLRDRPRAQGQVSSASAGLSAARAYLHQSLAKTWDRAVAGNESNINEISVVWSAALHAMEISQNTVNAMFEAGGTSAMYTDNYLERAHRDISAMMRHVVAQPLYSEQSGRVLFGLEPNDPWYAI
jgi:alkylation response protein AidB-like acyl-CoA dehydrogenase